MSKKNNKYSNEDYEYKSFEKFEYKDNRSSGDTEYDRGRKRNKVRRKNKKKSYYDD